MMHETFLEYLERRDVVIRPVGVDRPVTANLGPHAAGDSTGAIASDDPRAMDDPVQRPDPLGKRSLFRGVFGAVNPARPDNSRP
jgi:hypothetical protein